MPNGESILENYSEINIQVVKKRRVVFVGVKAGEGDTDLVSCAEAHSAFVRVVDSDEGFDRVRETFAAKRVVLFESHRISRSDVSLEVVKEEVSQSQTCVVARRESAEELVPQSGVEVVIFVEAEVFDGAVALCRRVVDRVSGKAPGVSLHLVRVIGRSDTGEKTDVEFFRNNAESEICRPADHLCFDRFVAAVFKTDFSD